MIGMLMTCKSRWAGTHNNNDSGNNAIFEELNQIRDENYNLLSEIRIKEIRIEEQKFLLDSLRMAIPKPLRPRRNEIRSVDRFTIKADTALSSLPVFRKDSVIKVEKHDQWLSAVTEIREDSAIFRISFKDTITRTEVYKKHLFRANEHYILLQSSSPYTSIKEGFSFTIKERKPIISIGPSITYQPFVNRISLGISVQIPIVLVQIKK
jgi:hypothetical protein